MQPSETAPGATARPGPSEPAPGLEPHRPLALVTGASSGIGADLARQLGADGHDLILVARRIEAMQALSGELRAGGARTLLLAADLGRPGAAADLVREIDRRGLTIDVLVNCAGLGAGGPFERADRGRIAEMLQVNVVALTELTSLLVPRMVARRRGRILLTSSTTGFQPDPQMAVYGATKAFVLSLGEAIAYELRGSGVAVTTLCPGATATGFARAAGAESAAVFRNPLLCSSSAAVARSGYRGFKAGRRVVVTGLVNRLCVILGRHAPRFVSLPIVSLLLSSDRGPGPPGEGPRVV